MLTAPAVFAGPGWYRVREGSLASSQAVFVDLIPDDPEWPLPCPWLGCWLREDESSFESLAIIRGDVELIDAILSERIITGDQP